MAGLKGKTGIVTGGSSGIGFQIANVLAQAGATVYVISRTGKPKEGVGESAPGVVHLRGDIERTAAHSRPIVSPTVERRRSITGYVTVGAVVTNPT